jgi:5'-3' exoribonuclease 1
MRAIQWNLRYYFRGIPSWNWYYPYNYAPFASDLLDLFDTTDLYQKFDLNEPVSSITHLLAILPSQSEQLLPTLLQGITRNELSKFYPIDFPTDSKPTQRYWEAIVVLPYVCKVSV